MSAGPAAGSGLGYVTDLAAAYGAACEALEDVVDGVREAQRAAARKREYMIRRRAAEVMAARDALKTAILAQPELFERPRTRAKNGVQFGIRKRPGKIVIDNVARAIERIRRVLPSRADDLISVKESLPAAGLKKLDAAELAAIGARLEATDDEPIIKRARTDLDKLVDLLLDDAKDPEKDT